MVRKEFLTDGSNRLIVILVGSTGLCERTLANDMTFPLIEVMICWMLPRLEVRVMSYLHGQIVVQSICTATS